MALPRTTTTETHLTVLLARMQEGDRAAEAEVLRTVFDQLRGIARRQLARERSGHTLQPTELVHEAYMKLIGQKAPWQNRAQFFAVASAAMRRLLVDHARARASLKRGGNAARVELGDQASILGLSPEEMLSVDQALSRLESLEPRHARIVQMRFFAGLGEEEIAQVLGVTPRTVRRDWEKARSWLYRELQGVAGSVS